MTEHRPDILISPHDLEIGLARRSCVYCDMPLIIRLPLMADAIRDQGSAALSLGFLELTPMERELFDAIYEYFPRAVTAETVTVRLHHVGADGLRVHTSRMRAKIRKHGWEVIRWNGALRLVEPVPVV